VKGPGLSPDLLYQAISFNDYGAVAPWVDATGFRTMRLRYRERGGLAQTRLAEDFLMNTRLLRSDPESDRSIQTYFTNQAIVVLSLNGHEAAVPDAVKLPPGVPLELSLGDAMGRRRSSRTFTGDVVPVAYFASIVRAAGSVSGRAEVQLSDGGQVELDFRTTPSGGGLYPVELFALVQNVEGLPRRVYRYNPVGDVLVPVGGEDTVADLLKTFTVTEEFISLSRANVIVFLVGRPWKSMCKYGRRGLRFLFLEAGCMAENIHLAVAGLGLGSVDCASVCDDEVHSVFSFDGVAAALLHTVVIGCVS
jgi:SagB-type dehydrogenase family enzyme